MALGKIKVDDDQLAGAQLSKAEKKRLRRQEKKLKKFGIRDESKMNKVEKFFYNIQKRRRIKKRKRVSRSFSSSSGYAAQLSLMATVTVSTRKA